MQRLILQASIVLLLLSGLACACPSIAAADLATDHGMHEAHVDEAGAEAQPCCDDCDSVSAMHPQTLPVVLDLRFMDDPGYPGAALPVAIDTEWDNGSPAEEAPPDRSRLLPHETPVELRDRMLD